MKALCRIFVFASILLISPSMGQLSSDDERTWTKMTNLYQSYAFPFKDSFAQLIYKMANESALELSHECQVDLLSFAHQLDIGTSDAMSMLDSFSTRKAGSSSGLLVDLGSWQVCRSVLFNGSPAKQSFLLPQMPPKIHQTLHNLPGKRSSLWSSDQMHWIIYFSYAKMPIAICLPSTCSNSDVKELLNSHSLAKATDPIKFELMQPYTNSKWSYQLTKSVAKVVLATIFILNVLCTLFRNKLRGSIFSAFDLESNLNSLVKVNNNPLKFISTIKLVYLIVATILHLLIPIMYFQVFYVAKPFVESVTTNLFLRLSLSIVITLVSLNFVITSTLATLTLLPVLKKIRLNASNLIVNRALRTLPVVIVIILTVIALPDFNFTSPFTHLTVSNMSGTCFEHSWAELTFISNFRPLSSMCNRVTWFISADMQLFVAFLPLIFYLKNNYHQRQFIRSLLITILISGYISFIIKADQMSESFRNVILEPKRFLMNPDSFVQLYFNSFNYISPYAAGILIGYEILNGFTVPPENFKSISFTIWALLTFALSIPLIIINYFIQFNWLIILSMAVGTGLFCCGLIMLFMLLHSCPEDSVVKIISGHLYVQVANKLSFCFFLVHPYVIVMVYSYLEIHFTSYFQLFMVTTPWVLIIGGLLAAVVHLFVELPIAKLITRVLSRGLVMKKKQAE